MIKRWVKIYVLVMLPFFTEAQKVNMDSLVQLANLTTNDTFKIVRLRTISRIYAELNPDSAYHYGEVCLALAQKMHLKLEEASALQEVGYAFLNRGNYPRSLQTLLSSMAILADPKSEQNVLVGKFPGDDEMMDHTAAPHLQRLSALAFTQESLGILYANSNNYERARYYHILARQAAEQAG